MSEHSEMGLQPKEGELSEEEEAAGDTSCWLFFQDFEPLPTNCSATGIFLDCASCQLHPEVFLFTD